MSLISDNVKSVRDRIQASACRAGVDPSLVTLVAVTKTIGVQAIEQAIEAGVTDIGENYVQEALSKFPLIGHKARWHMIGHLQTNKVKSVIPVFDLVQSVDSLRLAREIGKRSLEIGSRCQVLVEVNISGEDSKSGVGWDEALDLCGEVVQVSGVELVGLMGIAAPSDDADIRMSFRQLRKLWDELPARHRRYLSMGMSSDFEMAIEEGSNMVRVGTAIFGPRG